MSALAEKWISFLEIKKKKKNKTHMNNGSVTSGVWDFFQFIYKKGRVFCLVGFFLTETSPAI